MAVGTKAKKETSNAVIEIQELDSETVEFTIIGKQPIILNKLSQKAKMELLYPSPRKSSADKTLSLKHDPIQEFQDSAHTIDDPFAETLLSFPASGIKKAMATAVKRTGGMHGTELSQLVWVEGADIPVFGIPKLFMSVTRMADMKRTPDVRTRCIVPEWTSSFRVTFIRPNLNERAIANLVHAAGLVSGLGDWRTEKGAGTFGQFTLVDEDNVVASKIRSEGGREVQIAAMEAAMPYDSESESLLAWYLEERERRGQNSKKK